MSLREDLRRFLLVDLLFGEDTGEFSDDDDLFAVGLDSMGILRTTAFLEQKTGTQIPPEDLTHEHFQSIRKLADHVSELRAADRAGGAS